MTTANANTKGSELVVTYYMPSESGGSGQASPLRSFQIEQIC